MGEPVCAAPISGREATATGTHTGYARHRRAGEPPCDACRAAENDRGRKYYQANLEKSRAKRRQYAADNRDEMTERANQWSKDNRERDLANRREKQRRYRARQLDRQIIPFTQAELAERLSMFSGCWVCGNEATEVDHVKPLKKGGVHALSNLRPICQHCNRTKHNRWPFEAVNEEMESRAI